MLLIVLLEFSDKLTDLRDSFIPSIVAWGQNMRSTITNLSAFMDVWTNYTAAILTNLDVLVFIVSWYVFGVSNWDIGCYILLKYVISYV